jgi:hypothetical protein
MSNNAIVGSLRVTPNFVVTPGVGNSGIIARLNPTTRYEIEVDQVDGRLVNDSPITIKNGINDVEPVRLVQLIDVDISNIANGATLIYNADTEFFEVRILDEFENLSISNTLVVTSLSANGSVGTAGQVLLSNGTNVYWGDQVSLPDEIDGGFF